MGTILNSETMDVWVEGSDKRKLTNGPVLKSFYDNETDQWVGPDDISFTGIVQTPSLLT